MSHRTAHKGDRAWFGKLEAKLSGRKTRRREDRRASLEEVIIGAQVHSPPYNWAHETKRLVTSRWWLWDGATGCFHDRRCLEAWEMVPVDATGAETARCMCRHHVWLDPDYARESVEENTEAW